MKIELTDSEVKTLKYILKVSKETKERSFNKTIKNTIFEGDFDKAVTTIRHNKFMNNLNSIIEKLEDDE